MQVGPYTFPPLHINLDSLSNTWFLQVVIFKSSGWVGVQSYLQNSADPQNTLPLHYSASPPERRQLCSVTLNIILDNISFHP